MLVLSVLLASGPAYAQKTQLGPQELLRTGEWLTSPGNKAFAKLQSDGNLVVYRGTPSNTGAVVWATDKPNPNPQILVMQTDGNLVQYTGTGPGQTSGVTWAHNTPRVGTEPVIARLTDGGELIVETATSKTVSWSSHRSAGMMPVGTMRAGEVLVSPSRTHFLSMQHDGNLVVYKGSGPGNSQGVAWATNKPAAEGAFLSLGVDGNLCVFKGTVETPTMATPFGAPVKVPTWCSSTAGPGTAGDPGRYMLKMQDDGNLCVFSGGPREFGSALWCTKPLPALATRLDYVNDPNVQIQTGDRIAIRSMGFYCSYKDTSVGGHPTVWTNRIESNVMASSGGKLLPVVPWGSLADQHLMTVERLTMTTQTTKTDGYYDLEHGLMVDRPLGIAKVLLRATDGSYLSWATSSTGVNDATFVSTREEARPVYLIFGRELGGTPTKGNHGFLGAPRFGGTEIFHVNTYTCSERKFAVTPWKSNWNPSVPVDVKVAIDFYRVAR